MKNINIHVSLTEAPRIVFHAWKVQVKWDRLINSSYLYSVSSRAQKSMRTHWSSVICQSIIRELYCKLILSQDASAQYTKQWYWEGAFLHHVSGFLWFVCQRTEQESYAHKEFNKWLVEAHRTREPQSVKTHTRGYQSHLVQLAPLTL